IFPLIIVFGAFLNKKKDYVLILLFFLLTLFLVTANITHIGFFIYENLFRIPGFAMFRNFFGQWAFVYIFFYSLTIGTSLVLILKKLKKIHSILLIIVFCLVLGISSWPFISGQIVNTYLPDSKSVKLPIVMDTNYEKFLLFLENTQIDG